jgi:hypothetical protein
LVLAFRSGDKSFRYKLESLLNDSVHPSFSSRPA